MFGSYFRTLCCNLIKTFVDLKAAKFYENNKKNHLELNCHLQTRTKVFEVLQTKFVWLVFLHFVTPDLLKKTLELGSKCGEDSFGYTSFKFWFLLVNNSKIFWVHTQKSFCKHEWNICKKDRGKEKKNCCLLINLIAFVLNLKLRAVFKSFCCWICLNASSQMKTYLKFFNNFLFIMSIIDYNCDCLRRVRVIRKSILRLSTVN